MAMKQIGPAPMRTRRIRAKVGDSNRNTSIVEREVQVTGQEPEANILAERLAPIFGRRVEFYAKQFQTTPEEARERANKSEASDREAIAGIPLSELEWKHLSALAREDFAAMLELWEKIKQRARERVEHGEHISELVYPNSTAQERAEQWALREQVAEGWNPQNGIEHVLIDTLAITFGLWLEWTAIAQQRTTREAVEPEAYPYRSEREWKVPRYTAAMAMDQAVRLADGYNRQFLRVLRQLRDLRRYTPPTIINQPGGQVNVANQQVNVSK